MGVHPGGRVPGTPPSIWAFLSNLREIWLFGILVDCLRKRFRGMLDGFANGEVRIEVDLERLERTLSAFRWSSLAKPVSC